METDWISLKNSNAKARFIDIPYFSKEQIKDIKNKPFSDENFSVLIAYSKRFISFQGLLEYKEVSDKRIQHVKTFYLVKDKRSLYETITNYGLIDSARSCFPEYYRAHGVIAGTQFSKLQEIIRDHSLNLKRLSRGDLLNKDSKIFTAIYFCDDLSNWYLTKSDFKGNVIIEKM